MSEEIKWAAPRGPGRGGKGAKAGRARSRRGLTTVALGLLLAGAGIYRTMSASEEDGLREAAAGLESFPEGGPVFPSLEKIKRADSLAVFKNAKGRSGFDPMGGSPP